MVRQKQPHNRRPDKSRAEWDREIIFNLLLTLDRLNEDDRKPMKGEWLNESDLGDKDTMREYYYGCMDTLIKQKMVKEESITHGTAVSWERHKITAKGMAHIDAIVKSTTYSG